MVWSSGLRRWSGGFDGNFYFRGRAGFGGWACGCNFTEDFIGFGNANKLVLGFAVVGVYVGVKATGESSIGGFNVF